MPTRTVNYSYITSYSTDFFTCRGCVVRARSGSASAYKIDGWCNGAGSGYLITVDDVNITDKDLVLPVTAVDDKRVFYRFGKNFGQIQVIGTVYCGCAGRSYINSALGKVQQAFESIRVSKSGRPKNVSVSSGFKCKAYFTDLTLGQVDAEHNSIKYVLSGYVVPKS